MRILHVRLFSAFTALALTVLPVAASVRPEAVDRIEGVAAWVAPPVDEERLRLEETQRDPRVAAPYRVGHPFRPDLRPESSGEWSSPEPGRHRWSLAVRSTGARWLVLGFERFHPVPGAVLTIRTADGRVHGPWSAADAVAGQLWTPPLAGDTATLALDGPLGPSDLPDVVLSTVAHGYRSLDERDEPPAVTPAGGGGNPGACEIDVACSLGDAWQDEKRGIVRMMIGGVATCTGSLVNNTAYDCTPYVLTGDHCFGGMTGLEPSVIFLFDYERPACDDPGPVAQNRFAVGSVLRASYPASDSRLLEITGTLPEGLDLYFNGWSRLPNPPRESFTIHHPVGSLKKISFNADALAPGLNGNAATHWRVTEWEQGATEGGSSGAPLFDPQGRVVATLHLGSSACDGSEPNDQGDDFGRLDQSFFAGNLDDYLDPAGLNVGALIGMDDDFCGAPAPRLASAGGRVDDGQGNDDGALDPGDVAIVELDLTNAGPLNATGSVAAQITSADSEVTVRDEGATFPAIGAGQVRTSQAPHFTVDLDPGRACGRSVVLEVEASSAQGSWTSELRLPTGQPQGTQPVFEDDVEGTISPFDTEALTGSQIWERTTLFSHSPQTSWRAPNAGTSTDLVLISPQMPDLGPGAVLRFFHAMSADVGNDGGVLEYRTDSPEWFDLGGSIVENGYNSVLPGSGFGSSIEGRTAWSYGDSVWREVEVDLSDFEGENLEVRWRFATDSSGSGNGWFVDDVVIETEVRTCADPAPRYVPGARCRGFRQWDGDCGVRRERVSRPAR